MKNASPGEVPPRVLAAEARRDFRELLARSSLGCPTRPNCGHLLSDHDCDGYDESGDPIHPVCRICGCAPERLPS